MIELAGYSRGYAAGVAAARNVVLAYVHPECLDEDNPQCDVCPELIDRADAIDALKEKP